MTAEDVETNEKLKRPSSSFRLRLSRRRFKGRIETGRSSSRTRRERRPPIMEAINLTTQPARSSYQKMEGLYMMPRTIDKSVFAIFPEEYLSA
jgi:hypothetical protein